MPKQKRLTFRMGATAWGLTVPTPEGETYFDFSKMTRDQRRELRMEVADLYRRGVS